ncbi:2Fe-2S iron-sulfur cluster-binding protein [Piscinibacter koreensis]|uniref:2Fe-2S iron-sulfur cluster binding domain-containing protein n=1 Tax=Piscinibacter koreensis TaxID=2742824 RepID=A0A7Y6NSI5_9BURK|nr:2Fe-2S iron-sulfur cluster-binding protein [Schlegelella koreensis]NUZ08514.1 2Fe-2S iron-sulfur cluster binding domain-containing protein [Schlegelella koreensis]
MPKMMEGMMGGGRKELYPSLMGLPALTPEQRADVQRMAAERIYEGSVLLQEAQERLARAVETGDHEAASQALQESRDGVGQVDSGVAAHRLLQEGAPPRNIASEWFKREMNLADANRRKDPRTVLGVLPLHLFVMALLVAFAVAMVAMYFFKMRRTASLFGRIEPKEGPPPTPASRAGGAPADVDRPSTGGAPPVASGPTTFANEPAAVLPPGTTSRDAASPAPGAATTPVAPATAKWQGQLRVGAIMSETPSVKTLRLLPVSGNGPLPFTFLPGQFLNLTFWIGGAKMNRSYSISSSPTQRGFVDVTVKREPRGAVSRHVDDLLKVGDRIDAGGPVGRFTFTGAEADSIVLIAGGVGITPMMSITRYLTEQSWAGEIYFVYACRAPVDFVFAKDVAELQQVNPRLHVAVTMERPEGTDWQGHRGRITKEFLAETIPGIGSRRIHLCGPPVMMDAVRAILNELKVPPEQVKTEDFGTAAPTPGGPGATGRSAAPATGPVVTFSNTGKASKSRDGQTVLELSEELDIGIEFACRVGTCGICKVKMTSGEVDMAVDDALDAEDKASGIILACQAKPRTPITVEA